MQQDNGGDERLGSDLGSEMMKMILKEEEEEQEEDLLDVVDEDEEEEEVGDSIFYGDFASLSLPQIPCLYVASTTSSSMSTCTSSSSSCSASSSSTSSWAVVKVENEDDPSMEIAPPSSDHASDSIDVLEELGGIDLLDSSGIWDPSPLFPFEQEQEQDQDQEKMLTREGEERPSEDLAMVFFEWLKSNKEAISPEDLRSIKLKRSTIECAARRLGGGKEGMMQLLKLILQWVQNHHLQKKRNREEDIAFQQQQQHQQQQQAFPVQVPLPNSGFPVPVVADSNAWISNSSFSEAIPAPSMMGYHYPPLSPSQPDYQMLDSTVSWSHDLSHYSTFSDPSSPSFLGLANKHHQGFQMHGVGERFVKMAPSATKEARKKRMARQKRFFYHHHHRHQNHHQHHHNNQQQQNQQQQLLSRLPTTAPQTDSSNWVMWSSSAAAASSSSSSLSPTLLLPDAPMQQQQQLQQQQQRQVSLERRQGWKPEKNLRFLLQKVLKQSDVGNLGRIVLPKKEAETHLPELEARDGISIAVEDIGTSRTWNMRYRFWPNNKSRMYLLENTGDFVRSNGLQEGDFIVLYSDTKCGKYMIRGVKVRKTESKQEARNPGKMQRNPSLASSSSNGDGSSSSLSFMQTGTA